MGKAVRIVTATATLNGSENMILFDSALAINFNLGPAFGDGREFEFKNIGTGAVTLLPYLNETIFAEAEVSSKILLTGESAGICDAEAEKWVFKSFEFEITPLSEGGTGIEVSGRSSIIYVDGNRTDSYTADGTYLRPFKIIQPAIDLVAALTTAGTYIYSNYVIDVTAGLYSGNLAIGNVKNLRFQLHGAYISGNIVYTTTMVGGSADNYYSRLEFVGVAGNRPEKGASGRLTGTFTATRNNDSLSYVSFSGIDLQGAIAFNTNGTWVVAMHNTMLSARMSCGDAAIALLETTGHTIITGHLAAAADAVTAISLYNVDNCEFDLINISNAVGSRVTNCRFNSNVTVTGGTFAVDANSYKSAIAQTENFTGATLSFLDNTGANVTPIARTNNPTLAANTINSNIAALDAAVGVDLTPGTRTTGQLAVANSVNTNIDLIDDVIGFDAQMPVSSINITRAQTIYQNLRALDTYKTVRTVKLKVGNVGVASSDFNFTSAADANEQSVDLGAILPAKCRLVDIMVYTDAAFTNLGNLTTDVGLTTGTNGLIGAANNTALDAIMAAANAGAFISTPNAAVQHVWLNVKPTNNWDSANPVGRMSVYVTFIDVSNV